jgi:hypothetical protein
METNLNSTPDKASKKDWTAPQLIDLDIKLTEGQTTGTDSGDGGAAFSDYLS